MNKTFKEAQEYGQMVLKRAADRLGTKSELSGLEVKLNPSVTVTLPQDLYVGQVIEFGDTDSSYKFEVIAEPVRAAIELPKHTCSADYRDTKGRTLSPDKLEIGQVFLMNGVLSKVTDIVDGKPSFKINPY